MNATQAIIVGSGFGVSAMMSPGPLFVLTLNRSLTSFAAGVRIAVAPLITDCIVIITALFAVHSLPATMIHDLGIVGGSIIAAMGIAALRRKPSALEHPPAAHGDLRRGLLAAITSPQPWIFWLAIGTPLLWTMTAPQPVGVATFLIGFYGIFIGGRIGFAALVAWGRKQLSLKQVRLLQRGSAVALCASGLFVVATSVLS